MWGRKIGHPIKVTLGERREKKRTRVGTLDATSNGKQEDFDQGADNFGRAEKEKPPSA